MFIMSPTTISSMSISIILLFLITLLFIFDASSSNFSNAFSLPYSDMVDMNDARKIAITIPTVSYQLKSLNRNNVFIANAIKSIFIIGSPSVTNSIFKKLSFSFLLKILLPYFFLLSFI